MADTDKQIEVEISSSGGKAIIEGKTAVPFKTFVGLILQRKVQTLFKQCQDESVVIGSEVLTRLASAPDDKQEDRAKLVVLAVGIGVLIGIFFETAILVLLNALNIQPSLTELFMVLGLLVALVLLAMIIEKIQNTNVKQAVYDRVEQISNMF